MPHEPTAASGSICPLCGQNNGCAVHAGKDPAACWCMTVKVPPGLLEKIPPERRGQACVCQNCVKAYRDHLSGGSLS